jgi:hypothetical protein
MPATTPADENVWDGSVILQSATCPNNPSDNPLVGQSLGVGAPDIPTTDHDVMQDMMPTAIPPSQPAGSGGSFRFICHHTNLLNDDPTVYPNQPGVSHLHDQTGNYNWSAYSNYGNLRIGGGSGCNDVLGWDWLNKSVASAPVVRQNWAGNRTPYWQPALLDGKGNVRLTDLVEFYYKRHKIGDPACSDWTPAPDPRRNIGKCVKLPNGIKFIFGADVPNHVYPSNEEHFTFNCVYNNGANSHLGTLRDVLTFCEAQAKSTGQRQQVVLRNNAPECWDGVHLDSANHRSHMAYSSYGNGYGYQQCPSTHPFVIPTFTWQSWYSILPTDDTSTWKLSCSDMFGGTDIGDCMHVDYGPAAWDPVVLNMWENGCINTELNCNSGDMGNGYILKGAGVPIYQVNGVYKSLWQNPITSVPLSSVISTPVRP